MKKFAFIFFLFGTGFAYSQTEISIPWAMFHGCEKHCGVYPAKEYTTLGGIKWKFKTEGKIFSSPAVFNGTAFIGSGDGNLYAIDIKTGGQKWKFKTNGAVHSSPAVYKNTVYFGSFDGYYYAIDINTGLEKWKLKTDGEKWVGGKAYLQMKPDDMYMDDLWDYFLSSPIIDMNDDDLTVYFGSSDGNLFAIHANDGTLKWKFKTNGIIHTSPALYNGVVYIGSWDTYLYAVDAKTGTEKWKFKTGDQTPMSGIQSSPSIVDDIVYFGARDANMYALSASTGKLVWKYSADGSWIINTAAVKDGVLYVGTSDSHLLLALDAKTGKEKFRFKTNGYVFSSPSLVGATAYFGDFTGKMYALDLNSKGKKWSEFSTESRQKNAAQVLNKDTLDFQWLGKETDLSLYTNNAKVMDAFYTLGAIVSSPAIKESVIYFGSADGYLYALNLENTATKRNGNLNKHHQ